MATLTVQELTTANLTAAYSAVEAGGDEFINDGNTFLHIRNTAGASITVTVASKISPVPKGLAQANITITLGGTVDVFSGFFSPEAYNDSSGMVQLTYSATQLTIAAISVT